jgi:hypothetical protein
MNHASSGLPTPAASPSRLLNSLLASDGLARSVPLGAP